MDLLNKLEAQKLIHPPKWMIQSVAFMGYTGSVAYGASSDTSDMDCVGFCVPPKDMVFPYASMQHILHFGTPPQRFRVWQEHHINVPDSKRIYDFAVYNIVDFFHLAMENNPNILDALFLPRRCILHQSNMWWHMRANRHKFLHKGAYRKFRGYAHAQMAKIAQKTNSSNPKRAELIAKHGYDTKFAMHVVRLALQAEYILQHQDLDLEANSKVLKSVREGVWTEQDLREWYRNQEMKLEILLAKSALPDKPDEDVIRGLLFECLRMAYGSLTVSEVKHYDRFQRLHADMTSLLAQYAP